MATKKVREQTRNKALELLSPHLLESAENVGQAAHEWQLAEAEAEAKRAAYMQAWKDAKANGWTQAQLDQLVDQRPPSPRATGAKRVRPAETDRSSEQPEEATTPSEQPDPQPGAAAHEPDPMREGARVLAE